MSRPLVLVTCRQMPEPDPDQDLMLEALAGRGLSAGLAAWNDPDVDWSRSRVAVVRSTWDYYHDRDGFVRWAERAGAATRLFNPAPVLAWNSDKIYLGELAARGLSVVPTVFVERGERRDLGATMDERGWTKVVVKPRISAGSFETYAFERGALRGGELAGYTICSRYDTVWHIMNIAVDPDERRQGIARSLLLELFDRVGEGDHARFTLEVRQSNGAAIALYERFGFRSAGVRRRYYQDNGEDAIIMWRTPGTLAAANGGAGNPLADVPNAGPLVT